MSGYLTTLMAITILVGVCSYVSYGEKRDKCLKFAASLITLYAISSPIVTLIIDAEKYQIYDGDIEDSIGNLEETEFFQSAQEGFCLGIKKYVCGKFSLSEDDVKVIALEFDVQNMKAKNIRIILSGKAVTADSRAIAFLVSDSGLGECEVHIGVK